MDQLPEENQKVWYFFRWVGVWEGLYKGICPDLSYKDSDFPMTIFASQGGVLTGDVTHWMPLEDSEERPDEPSEEEVLETEKRANFQY